MAWTPKMLSQLPFQLVDYILCRYSVNSFRVFCGVCLLLTLHSNCSKGQILNKIFNSISVISDSDGNYYPYSYVSNLYKGETKGFKALLYNDSELVESITFDSIGRLTNMQTGGYIESIDYLKNTIRYYPGNTAELVEEYKKTTGSQGVKETSLSPEEMLDCNILENCHGVENFLDIKSCSSSYVVTVNCSDKKQVQDKFISIREGFKLFNYALYGVVRQAIEQADHYPELKPILEVLSMQSSQDSTKLRAYYNSKGEVVGFTGSVGKGRLFCSSVLSDLPGLPSLMFPTTKYNIFEYYPGVNSPTRQNRISFYTYNRHERDRRSGVSWFISAIVGDSIYYINYNYIPDLGYGVSYFIKIPKNIKNDNTITFEEYIFEDFYSKMGPKTSSTLSKRKYTLKTKLL